MQHQLYYEAKIQIRPFREDVISYVKNAISKRKDVFISKTEELKTGIDFYVSSQRFARALVKRLKKVFDGEIKSSRKLHTVSKSSGKKLYRVTVLFRLKEEDL